MPEITDGKYDPGDRLVSPSGEVLATWTDFGEGGAWQVCGGARFAAGSTCFLLTLKCGATVQRDVAEQRVWRDSIEVGEEGKPLWGWWDELPPADEYKIILYLHGDPEPIPADVVEAIVFCLDTRNAQSDKEELLQD